MELYIELNLKHVVKMFKCCHADTYQNQKQFKFLPAHRKVLLNMKAQIAEMKSNGTIITNHISQFTFDQFSPLLQIIILYIYLNQISTQFRYHEIIRYFAMYLYMVCGKLCYETLCSNLPLPQPSTVRKSLLFKHYNSV